MSSRRLAAVFAAVVLSAWARIPHDKEVTPDACSLRDCKCLQSFRLYCSCTTHQILELKGQGFGYLPNYITNITIEHCNAVFVFSNCLGHLKSLRHVVLKNVSKISLEEEAFVWGTTQIVDSYLSPGIHIEIRDSAITVIPSNTFMRHIQSISLENVRIDAVKAFAFSNLEGTERIHLKDCQVSTFEPQSFKKFIVDSFIIEGGRVKVMPSYTVKDLTIRTELRIEGLEAGLVRGLAVSVEGPTAFRLKGNHLEVTETEAWRVETQGPVFIEDNLFPDLRAGAFLGITLDPRYKAHFGKQEIIFENNTLGNFENWALAFNTTGLKPSIDRIVMNRECSCADITTWTSKLVKFFDNREIFPNVSKLMWCYQSKKDVPVSNYLSKYCEFNSYTVYWIVGIVLTVVGIIGICFIGIFLYRKYKKMYKEVKTNRDIINVNRLSTYSQNSTHIMVLPQSKVYKETEIDIFQEQAEPLKSQTNVASLNETGL